MYKVFDFKEQLSIGQKGEELFHVTYPELIRTDGRCGDFITPDGYIVELKCDSYSGSPNFFMERYSSIDSEKLGGPWQSQQGKVTDFVYYFVAEGIIYWFNVDQLVKWLDEHSKEYPVRIIRNRGWSAKGYLVPRKSIEHLAWQIKKLT